MQTIMHVRAVTALTNFIVINAGIEEVFGDHVSTLEKAEKQKLLNVQIPEKLTMVSHQFREQVQRAFPRVGNLVKAEQKIYHPQPFLTEL